MHHEMKNTQHNTNIMAFYNPQTNEKLVCIENFKGYSYSVYAVYVNGEYDRRIKISNVGA
jgi:hypothetical protein